MSIAFIFPGQGSQAVGMGAELAKAYPSARAVFDEVDAALSQNLSRLMWEGPEAELTLTENAQPALMAVSLAAMRVLGDKGLKLPAKVAYVAGHSLGEYSALAAAGALSLADTARLLKIRGRAMQEAVPVGEGAMAALLGADLAQAQELAKVAAQGEVCEAANDNAPGQVVISGTGAALANAEAPLRQAGARRVISLAVSGPFHSPWMAEVCDDLAHAIDQVAWHDADPPMISNVTGEPVDDAGMIRALLAEQVRSPVEWVASISWMVGNGVDSFIECGPGAALAGMVKRIAPASRTLNVNDSATLDGAVATVRALRVGTPA